MFVQNYVSRISARSKVCPAETFGYSDHQDMVQAHSEHGKEYDDTRISANFLTIPEQLENNSILDGNKIVATHQNYCTDCIFDTFPKIHFSLKVLRKRFVVSVIIAFLWMIRTMSVF